MVGPVLAVPKATPSGFGPPVWKPFTVSCVLPVLADAAARQGGHRHGAVLGPGQGGQGGGRHRHQSPSCRRRSGAPTVYWAGVRVVVTPLLSVNAHREQRLVSWLRVVPSGLHGQRVGVRDRHHHVLAGGHGRAAQEHLRLHPRVDHERGGGGGPGGTLRLVPRRQPCCRTSAASRQTDRRGHHPEHVGRVAGPAVGHVAAVGRHPRPGPGSARTGSPKKLFGAVMRAAPGGPLDGVHAPGRCRSGR